MRIEISPNSADAPLEYVSQNCAPQIVAAGLAFLGKRPDWLTLGLLGDLTTTYDAVVAAMAITGVALAIAVLALRAAVSSPEVTCARIRSSSLSDAASGSG